MNKKDINELTNEELIKEKNKIKSSQIIDASLIGVLIGILIYSIIVDNYSLLLGIFVLFAIFKIAKKNKYRKKEIDSLLKKRKLK